MSIANTGNWKFVTLLSCSLISSCSSLTSDVSRPSDENLRLVVDRLFSDFDDASSPGCAVGIQDHGETVLIEYYGMANIDAALPIGPGTHFNIASVSKQFTVLSILTLQAQGKLSINDDIREYIPEIAATEPVIRISNLIHHTSGLMSYTDYLYLAGLREFEGLQRKLAMELMTANFPLAAPVGSTWSYNNGAYVLLAEIVQRVSGRDFEAFAQQEVLAAVQMNSSYFRSRNDSDFGPVATPYYRTETGPVVSGKSVDYSGDGGLVTTVEDFLKYTGEIYRGENLWNDTNRIFMTTSGRLTGPEVHPETGTLETNYGGAIGLTPSHDRPLLSHTGSIDGFNSQFAYFPSEALAIVAFCNLSDVELGERFERIVDLYFGDGGGAEKKELQRIPKNDDLSSPVPNAFVTTLAGTFHSTLLKSTWVIEPLREAGFSVTLSSAYIERPIRMEFPLAALRSHPNYRHIVSAPEMEIRIPGQHGDSVSRFFVKVPALPQFEFSRVETDDFK